MSDLKKIMKTISGNEPTPEQINRVMSIALDMDISKTDPMLPVLVMLDQYHGVFSELPKKMREASDTVAQGAASRSVEVVNLAVAQAVSKLGPKVGDAILKVAKDINQIDKMKWVGLLALTIAIVFSIFGWISHTTGFSSGFETGKAAGYKAASNEASMAAWANTEQGRLAYELAQAGNLEMLANCNGRGWRLSKNICSPLPYKDAKDEAMVAGWSVGKSASGAPVRKINVSWVDFIFGDAA